MASGLQAVPADIRGLISSLKKMDKEANTELRNKVASISKWYAQGIIQASYSAPMPDQTAVVARSVRVHRDRIPNVTIGGTTAKTRRNGTPAGVLVKGNEFGGQIGGENNRLRNGGRKFPYRTPREGRGNRGYWIYPTLRRDQAEITRRWKAAVDDVLANWSKRGG